MIAALHSGTLNAQVKLGGLIEHFLFQIYSVKVNNRHVHESHPLLRVFEASNEKSVAPHVDGEHSTSNQRSKILPVDMTWRLTCGFEPHRASIVCTQNICAQHSAAMQSLVTISCATPRESPLVKVLQSVAESVDSIESIREYFLYYIPVQGAIARHRSHESFSMPPTLCCDRTLSSCSHYIICGVDRVAIMRANQTNHSSFHINSHPPPARRITATRNRG